MDESVLQRRILCHYIKLFPMTKEALTDKEKASLACSDCRDRVIFSNRDIMRPAFLYSLMAQGPIVEIDLLSVYDLIDIFLGNNTSHKRLLDITPPVLLMYAGYNEFPNKRLEEAALQVLSNQRNHRNNVWWFYKGSKQAFMERFPVLWKTMNEMKFEVVDLNTSSHKSVSEVEEF